MSHDYLKRALQFNVATVSTAEHKTLTYIYIYKLHIVKDEAAGNEWEEN